MGRLFTQENMTRLTPDEQVEVMHLQMLGEARCEPCRRRWNFLRNRMIGKI